MGYYNVLNTRIVNVIFISPLFLKRMNETSAFSNTDHTQIDLPKGFNPNI